MASISFDGNSRSPHIDPVGAIPPSEVKAPASEGSFESHLKAAETSPPPATTNQETTNRQDDEPTEAQNVTEENAQTQPTEANEEPVSEEPTEGEPKTSDDETKEVDSEEEESATAQSEATVVDELLLAQNTESNHDEHSDTSTEETASETETNVKTKIPEDSPPTPTEESDSEQSPNAISEESDEKLLDSNQESETDIRSTDTNTTNAERPPSDEEQKEVVKPQAPPETDTMAPEPTSDETEAETTPQRKPAVKRSTAPNNTETNSVAKPAEAAPVLETQILESESDSNAEGRRIRSKSTEDLQATPTNKNTMADTHQRFAQPLVPQSGTRAAKEIELNSADQARFVDRVARAFRVAEGRNEVVRLRLSPPELGSLRLEIKVQRGALSARLEADTSTTRSLLMDHLPVLRERLAEQGIRVEQFDVELLDRQPNGDLGGWEEHNQQSGDGREQPQRDDRGGESTHETNPHDLPGLHLGGDEQLDVVI